MYLSENFNNKSSKCDQESYGGYDALDAVCAKYFPTGADQLPVVEQFMVRAFGIEALDRPRYMADGYYALEYVFEKHFS